MPNYALVQYVLTSNGHLILSP